MRKLGISHGQTIRLSRILQNTFVRDKADFERFSTRFADPYADNFLVEIDKGAALPTVNAMKAAQKAVTKRMHSNMNAFRVDLMQLAALIGLITDNRTIANGDFGIKNVRDTLIGFKVSEFMAAMHTLLINVEANLAALKAVGLPDTFVADIGTRLSRITEDDKLQRNMISHQNQGVQDNAIQYGVIQGMMTAVMDSGKAIYKKSNPAKAKDYTLSELKRQHKASQNPPVPPAKV
jgi:hypothetical protein